MSEAIYSIYIVNHLNAAKTATVTTEELLYSIPITDSTNSLIDPVVKCDMGKAGSFEFSITPKHPFYDRFQQMKTVMRVSYSGENIFRGRVLTIDTNRMNGTRKVHLEGDLAFLNDSYQEGVENDNKTKTTIYKYLQSVIRVHNDQMDVLGNEYKKFTLGIVPGCPNYNSLTTAAQRITVEDSEFVESGWKKSQEVINKLTKEYGGYFRTRYENGTCYLDWLEAYFDSNVCGQPIQVTQNLIDLNDSSEVDNLFTYLIPIGNKDSKKIYLDGYKEDVHGANRSLSVPTVASWLTSQGRGSELDRGFHKKADYENAITNYGVIYRTQEFGDADTKEKLWNTAVNWVRDNYCGGITSFTATALDFRHINRNMTQKWIVGIQVPIIYPNMSQHTEGSTPTETSTITLLSGQYNLHNPDKNSYTLGIPSSLLSKSYNKRSNSKKSNKDAVTENNYNYSESNYEETAKDYMNAAASFIVSKKYNIEAYNELVKEDPKKAKRAINLSTILVSEILEAEDTQEMVLENVDHGKTSKDVGSIYEDTNGKQWKITFIGYRQLKIKPLVSSSKLPSSGTLYYVSGGVNHDDIVYGKSVSNVTYTAARTFNMKVDGNAGKISMGGPVAEDMNWSSEECEMINKIKNTLVLNAAEGYVSVGDILPRVIDDPLHYPTPTERLRMKTNPNNKSGEILAYNNNKTAEVDAPPTFGMYGSNGLTAMMSGMFGLDGSGNTSVIDIFGGLSKINLKDPLNAGSLNANDMMVELLGTDGGEVGVGKKTSGGGTKWQITLNKPLTWTDDDGNTHTVPSGTVGADDFYLDEIPSFKTNLAVINTAIIGVAHIGDLTAINAFIQNLQSENAIINRISAKNIQGNNVSATSFVGGFSGAPITYSYMTAGTTHSHGVFYSGYASPNPDNPGQITLTFLTTNPSINKGKYEINFNIADTQFYKDAVSASYSTGKNSVTVDSIGLASNYSALKDTETRTGIFIEAVASNGAKKDDKYITLSAPTTYNSSKNRCINLQDGSSVIGRVNVDSVHTAGYNSAHLSGTWDKTSSSLTNDNRITIEKVDTGSSDSLNYVISASASISYNSTTNKFTATSKAKVDGTQRGDDASAESGEITIYFNALQSSGLSAYRTISVKNGDTVIRTSGHLTDYGDGYGSVTISSIGLASNYSALTNSQTRSNIYIEAKASNGAKKDDKLLTLSNPTTYDNATKRCINLQDGSSVIGRVRIDSIYRAGYKAGWNAYENHSWKLPSDSPPSGYASGKFWMPSSISSITDDGAITWNNSNKEWTEWTRGTNAWDDNYQAGRNSVKTIKPTDIRIGSSSSGTSLGTLSGASAGKYIYLKVGNTQYSIHLT